MVKVIGIGLACLDYLLRVPDLRTVHRGCRLEDFKMQGGGLVATAMVAVARLGGRAELWNVVGEDHHGRLIEEELLQEGVDLSQIVRLAGHASPFNFVLVDGRTGERVFLSPGSDWQPSWLEVERDWSRIDSADSLLVDGFWKPWALKGLSRAREKGVPTCGDIGHIAGNEELLELIDYLVVPRHAAEEIAGSAGPEALKALSGFGARMVAITMGPQGAIYLANGKIEEIPAFEVEAVDTTGAGDVFHGAFAYGVARGWTPRRLMLFSSAVAALKCTKLGGRTGIPNLAQTRRFLEGRMSEGDLPACSADRSWLTLEG
ncbi:MAG: PfkB family carbohydrate kinase [Chloroflexota bacterium]|nr:PfkB family carbohydrate kinase [Chloroflexota bacterium]